uniref:Uncharacterized protein n=1 Tax=Meloidogyne enterolobii TaxID=390850 RepID=A0A6V7Y6E6_MELEN|nr:unnamed protein product [Meloidogyne enterolobii]
MEVVPIKQNLNDQEYDLNNKGNPLPIVQLFSSNFDLNPILSKKQTGDSFFSSKHPINSGISPVDQNMSPNHQNFEFNPNQILPNHSRQNVNVPFIYSEGHVPSQQYGGPNFGYKPSQNLHMGGANYNNQHHAQQTVHNPKGQIIISI